MPSTFSAPIVGCVDGLDHLAREDLRIAQRLVDRSHRAARHAGGAQPRDERIERRAAAAPLASRALQFVVVRDAAGVRREARVARRARRARARAQNLCHCVSLPTASTSTPSAASNVSYGAIDA